MKKFKLLLAAVLITGFTAVSCSNDDDNGPTGPITTGNIEAKWNPVKTNIQINSNPGTDYLYDDNEATCAKDYIEFASNHDLNRVAYVLDVNNQCQASSATD